MDSLVTLEHACAKKKQHTQVALYIIAHILMLNNGMPPRMAGKQTV